MTNEEIIIPENPRLSSWIVLDVEKGEVEIVIERNRRDVIEHIGEKIAKETQGVTSSEGQEIAASYILNGKIIVLHQRVLDSEEATA